MKRESKTTMLFARVDTDVRKRFIEKAGQFGTPSEIIRELVTAFIEDRLQIEPPTPTYGKKEKLYVTRKED